MKSAQLDHLNMTVKSLTQSEDFYRKLFGLEKVEFGVNIHETKWAILSNGKFSLCLYEEPKRKKTADNDSYQRLYHFALNFNKADFEVLISKIQKMGLTTSYDSPVEYPHSTSYYIEDPSGYSIELVCWKTRIRF